MDREKGEGYLKASASAELKQDMHRAAATNGLLSVAVVFTGEKTAIVMPVRGERLVLAVVLFEAHQQP